MSGETAFPVSGKSQRGAYQERFAIESDRRLFGCMGSGSIFGVILVTYALSIQILIPPFHDPEPPDGTIEGPRWPEGPGVIRVKPPSDYHGRIRDRRLVKVHPKPGQPGQVAAAPKTRKPADKEPGSLGVSVIASLRNGLNAEGAYGLLPASIRNVDLNKLEEFGALTRTDKTRLGGRRGKQDHGFNEAYTQGGTGGDGGSGIELPKFTPDRIEGKPRQPESIGKMVEIDQFQNTTSRSSASILAVIRSHSPGLRHVYNTCLKMRPGLAGKITLRFAIAPSGQVVDVGLAGSTTSAPDFDAQIVEHVMAWRFEPVKAIGNDLVTVPFNFSE